MAVAKQKTSAAKAVQEQDFPSDEEVRHLQRCMATYIADERFAGIRGSLKRLASFPPQVVLIEGGHAAQRKLTAEYWTLLLNCEQCQPLLPVAVAQSSLFGDAPVPSQEKKEPLTTPCLQCTTCIRMLAHQHRDMFFLDGQATSIKIDDVRELRPILGEPPREVPYRVITFFEAQNILEAAANALLKSFEEPRQGTTFVLLAPQRERLLPTLVSRSMCLTLPWPRQEDAVENDAMRHWLAILRNFLQSGQGLFAYSGSRGEVTASLVQGIIEKLRGILSLRIQEEYQTPQQGSSNNLLARIPFARLRMVDEVLAESQDSLVYMANPSLVLEWLATRLYLLQVFSRR